MHTKLDALRRQAEVQFAAQDFEAALASFDAALQIDLVTLEGTPAHLTTPSCVKDVLPRGTDAT